MNTPTTELRNRALRGKTERETFEMKAHWALSDLSGYFHQQRSPLYYATNELIHSLYKIRPKPLSGK